MSPSRQPSWPVQPRYFTSVLGNGEVCPISELIGRRRVRSIDARSSEGRRLLRSGAVTVALADGRSYSGLTVIEVFDRLVDGLQRLAEDPGTDPRAIDDLQSLQVELTERKRTYS